MPPKMVEMLFTNPNLGLKFQPKVKLVLLIVGLPRGILEIGRNPLLVVKPRLLPRPHPSSKTNMDVRTFEDISSILKLGIFMERSNVTEAIS
jgi:hypothetical protein